MTSKTNARRIVTLAALILATVVIFCAYFTEGAAERIASTSWAKWTPVLLFILGRAMFSEKGDPQSRVARTSYTLPGGVGYLVVVATFTVAALGVITLDSILFKRGVSYSISEGSRMTLDVIGGLAIIVIAVAAGRRIWLRLAPKHQA